MGVSLMIMGSMARQIHTSSLKPYSKAIAREEKKTRRLDRAEKWKELTDLGISFIVFLVPLSPSI